MQNAKRIRHIHHACGQTWQQAYYIRAVMSLYNDPTASLVLYACLCASLVLALIRVERQYTNTLQRIEQLERLVLRPQPVLQAVKPH